MRKIILTILLIGFYQSLFDYPISPVPLRKLVIESDIIIEAFVLKTERENSDYRFGSSIATLLIQNVIKGKLIPDTIYVYYTPDMICPAPARYRKSTTVLAFIEKRKEGHGYTTPALSYGSKSLTTSGLKLYKSRIYEIMKIEKIGNKTEKLAKTIEWLISCASYPETRWEGIYELSPESDYMFYYDQSQNTSNKKFQLTQLQKEKLRKTLFSIPVLLHSDIGLVDLVKLKDDPELIEYLIKSLKSFEKENYWYADMVMNRIAVFSERDDLAKLYKKMEKLDFFDDDYENKRVSMIQKFIKQI